MDTCTVTRNLEIVKGAKADYEMLSNYHYREHHLGPYAAIFAMKGSFRTVQTVGVIVYAMPAAGCQMRSVAIGMLKGLDKVTRLKIINKNIRTISRVIIEPRFRSLGLAVRLVKETMPLMKVPFIEALAVMGRVNPFFEKAGMSCFDSPPEISKKFRGLSPGNPLDFSGPPSVGCVRLIEAFGAVGIDEWNLVDTQLIQQKLDAISSDRSDFIEREIILFLQGYGQRRLMQPGIERTRFIVSKLTDSPVYYLWKNPSIELRI